MLVILPAKLSTDKFASKFCYPTLCNRSIAYLFPVSSISSHLYSYVLVKELFDFAPYNFLAGIAYSAKDELAASPLPSCLNI